MAELHLARLRGIEGFEKLIALKCIAAGRDREGDLVELFLEEARLAARLHHPNVVQVHDAGVIDGRYYLAMELVHGVDVRELLRVARAGERRLRIDEIVAIGLGVCAGLHHAHEQRTADGTALELVHRDVSPSNVLVSYAGDVKVVDFGIARAADRQSWTAPGAVRGKVGYLSPEQVRDEPLDRRSDVFAVGLLLYELTTGERAYDGPVANVLAQVLAGPPRPPSQLWAGVRSDFEAIVMRALAHDREQRYPTARALQLDLERLARDARLTVSAVTLEELMRELFAQRMAAYHQAEKTSSLAEHVLTTMTVAVGPSPRAALVMSPAPALPAPLSGRAAPSRARRWLMVGALAAVVAAAAAAVGLASSSHQPAPAVAEEHPAAHPTSAAPATEADAHAPAPPPSDRASPPPTAELRPDPARRRRPARSSRARAKPSSPPSSTPAFDPEAALPPGR